MSKQATDDRQRKALSYTYARRRMPEVMNSDAIESGSLAQPFPRLGHVHERFAVKAAFDDEYTGPSIRPFRELAQHRQRGIAQKEQLWAGFAIG